MRSNALLLVMFLIRIMHVMSYCSIKHVDQVNCIYEKFCTGNLKNSTFPHTCVTGKPILYLRLHNMQPPKIKSYVNNQMIEKIDASGNHWTYIPIDFLKNMINLRSIKIVNHNITILSSKSFYHLNKLQVIDLSKGNIDLINAHAFKFIHSVTELEDINLSRNKIKEIPDYLFDSLYNLKRLDLSFNNIEDLSENSFYGLSSIEILKLNNNNMLNLKGALKKMKTLKQLYLRGNHFHQMSVDEIPNLGKTLIVFDMSQNSLSNVQPDIFKRDNATVDAKGLKIFHILLSGNKIDVIENASFEDAILNDESLHYNATPTNIDLSSNIISEVAFNAFQGVKKLIRLDLSSNQLLVFSINMNNMKYLENLNLKNNLIHIMLSESFSRMTNLRNLDLTNNNIDFVASKSFAGLRYLVGLNMSNNQLTEMIETSLSDLEFLDTLDLSNNKLKKVYMLNTRTPQISSLILRSNEIMNMSYVSLKHLLKLKYLDISWNKINYLDHRSFENLTALKSLNIESNRIEVIVPSSFNSLGNLEVLKLANNKISQLDYGTFNGLNTLKELDISHNKLNILDSKMFYELKTLKILKVDNNEIYSMNLDIFRTSPGIVSISLGGNNLSCDWLTTTINEANHGWLHIHMTSRYKVTAQTNVNGIQCIHDDNKKSEKIIDYNSKALSKETQGNLLSTNVEILNAIKTQTTDLNKELRTIERLLVKSSGARYYSLLNRLPPR